MTSSAFLTALFDKGLLAVVLAVFAFWLSTRLERFRSRLARSTELARERLSVARAASAACRELEHRLLEARPIKELWITQLAGGVKPLEVGDRYTSNIEACEAALQSLVRLSAESEILFEASLTAGLREVVAYGRALVPPQGTKDALDQAHEKLARSISDALGAFRTSLGRWE